MCGITGIVSKKDFSVNKVLIRALKRLEYRGYDSWGYAVSDGILYRHVGGIEKLPDDVQARAGISHTRWATHGGVTETNCHPHVSDEFMVVHNGIIENYLDLRAKLEKEGYEFRSDTDTEVIPHYFNYKQKQGRSMKESMFDFIDEVKGTFAVLLMKKGEDKIYALKRDSPLVLGLLDDSYMLASDVYAFSDKSDRAIFFEDNEFAIISGEGYEFFDFSGKNIIKKVFEFEWTRDDETKENYPHYMIKEIKEQPETARRLIQSLTTIQKDRLKRFAEHIFNSKRVVFVSCGTSYHASLVGVYLLNKLGIRSYAVIASEAGNFLDIDSGTTVVAVSQSGETMDVVVVLKEAIKKGAKILSIVNVPYSTVQRYSAESLEIMAGQEVCVAATKSFTNQLITLYAIADELGYDNIDLKKIPARIRKTIDKNENKIRSIAKKLKEKKDIFVLGRGMSYPIAREIALKLKEIPYIHAEGMMAGELKHGTIALVEDGTPIISLVSNDDPDMVSSTREVEARGADVLTISNTAGDLTVARSDDAEFSLYAALIGHLLSYHIAKMKGLPIDKPRNLAKSVTVK